MLGIYKRAAAWAMGSQVSYCVNAGVAKLAFQAPVCGYTLGQCENVHTASGERIATRLYTPLGEVLCPTKQRWIARKHYEDGRMLFIFSHGNADDLQTCSEYTQWLADTFDVNVLCYDYKGYGNSEPGTTTERSMQEAIEAVYALAVTRMDVPTERIILFGKSVGTGPTVCLASRGFESAGVVLVSPLASGARTLCDTSKVPRVVMSAMDRLFMPSVQLISKVTVPVCIIHGTEDTLIHIDNARDLHARCGWQSQFPALYVRAGHNDIESKCKEEFVQHVRTFLLFAAQRITDNSVRSADA